MVLGKMHQDWIREGHAYYPREIVRGNVSRFSLLHSQESRKKFRALLERKWKSLPVVLRATVPRVLAQIGDLSCDREVLVSSCRRWWQTDLGDECGFAQAWFSICLTIYDMVDVISRATSGTRKVQSHVEVRNDVARMLLLWHRRS